MKKLLILLMILLLPFSVSAIIDIDDVDQNGKADNTDGGTNSGLLMMQATIVDPDSMSTGDIPILEVESEWAPNGITIVDCGIKTDSASSYSVVFEKWTGPGDGSPVAIETVATSTSTEAEDDGTIDNADIDVGDIVYVDLPVTDIDMLQVWITYVVGVAADPCPSWSAYWNAWDGSYTSDEDQMCETSGASNITGTNDGGAFSGSGADTIWTNDADTDELSWASTAYDPDDTDGITIWMEVRCTAVPTGEQTHILQVGNDISDHAILTIKDSGGTDYLYYAIIHNSTTDDGWMTGPTCDGSTWNTIGFSWVNDTDGNDTATTVNDGGAWAENDEDLTDWAVTDDYLSLGENLYNSGNGNGFAVRRFAVVDGYQTASPW